MLVYRIEHKIDNRGPYMGQNSDDLIEMIEDHNDSPTLHPNMIKDCFDDWYETGVDTNEYICGFSSIGDLTDWFDKYIYMLQKNGFVICVFNIPIRSIRFGNKQVAFEKRSRNILKPVQVITL